MKSFRTLIGIAMFFLPFAAWAQNNSPAPPMPDPGETPPDQSSPGQVQTDASPAPARF